MSDAASNVQGDEQAGGQRAVSAGRGLVYITGAKLWFMIGGYAILFALPHLFDKIKMGQWTVILSWVSVINNVIVTATIQTVSKHESTDRAGGVTRAGLRLLFVVGGVVAAAFFLGAPLVARFEHDPALVPGLRLFSSVIFCYALYAVFVGAANGGRAFHKQAGLDASYTTLRAVCVIGAAVVLHTVLGAVTGMATAAAAILVVAALVVGLGRPGPSRAREMVGYGAGIALYLLIVNFLLFVDLWLLKRLVFEGAVAHGIANAADYASAQAAVYGNGVQAFARIPYQLILAVTFVVFPLVSRSTFAEDRDATRRYVERAMRYSLLVLAAMLAGIAARPDALIVLIGKSYTSGAPSLPPLAAGYLAFSLLSIAATIINGAGKTLPTIVIGAITFVVDAGANYLAVRWAMAGGHDPLLAASIATAAAMGLGLLLSVGYLQKRFGASLPLLSVVRCAAALAIAIAVGRLLPLHGILGLGACVVAALVFVGALFGLRELTMAEVRSLRRR